MKNEKISTTAIGVERGIRGGEVGAKTGKEIGREGGVEAEAEADHRGIGERDGMKRREVIMGAVEVEGK